MHKTKNDISIPIPKPVLRLLDHSKVGLEKLIFGILPNSYKALSTDSLGQLISSKNAYVNKRLTIIQKKAGMDRNLSFHKARHTFFVKGLKLGIDYMTLKELGGLSDVTILQKHYVEVLDSTLIEAITKFENL